MNKKINEAGDHEVGMAGGQLEAICKDATELLGKIGQSEKDIPGWIQSHITSAYEYLKQANDNYHELMPENKNTSKHVKLFEEFMNEAKVDNDYTFNNNEDYYKAVAVLRDAGFYRSGNGNPPKGDEPGTYIEDERWLNIRVIKGEKEALKLLKKSKIKYKAEYKEPMGYKIHNQGGYLD